MPSSTLEDELSPPETIENLTLTDITLTSSGWEEHLGLRMTTLLKTAMSYVEEQKDLWKAMDYLTAAIHRMHDWVSANQALATGWIGNGLLPLVHAKSFSFGFNSGRPNPLYAHSWELLNTPIGNTGLFPTTILIRKTGSLTWNVTRVFGSGMQETYLREQILGKCVRLLGVLADPRRPFRRPVASSRSLRSAHMLTKHRSRRRSLVLWGKSRLGKTVWSRSLGPHLYFCGLFSAAEAARANDVNYAVFDDIQGGIKFAHWFKNWLGCQQEFQIKQLYKDPQLIKWGKPCIWLGNNDPRDDITEQHDIDWLNTNCEFVELVTPLFTSHANTM